MPASGTDLELVLEARGQQGCFSADIEARMDYRRILDDSVAVIGYPAQDGDRNDQTLMDEVFRRKYQVKRFAPGFLTDRTVDGITLMGDYSSLGGNSGSPLILLFDGSCQGLHFAGRSTSG